MAEQYGPAEFVAEAAALVADGGVNEKTFAAIGQRLKRLAELPGLISRAELTDLHGSAATATILERSDDGSVLMLARFPAAAPTPVHNHHSWGVACVVQGRDRYQRWERRDDGSDPARGEVRMIEELELGPGEVVWFPPPPQDIHAQQGIGEAAWELVYFGSDPNASPRAYFDPDDGTITYDEAMLGSGEGSPGE